MYRGPLPGRETSVRDQEVLELEGEGLRVAGLVLAAPTRWSKPSGRPTCALTWANLKILQRRERLGFPRRTGLQRGHGVCVGGESLSFLSAFLDSVTTLSILGLLQVPSRGLLLWS